MVHYTGRLKKGFVLAGIGYLFLGQRFNFGLNNEIIEISGNKVKIGQIYLKNRIGKIITIYTNRGTRTLSVREYKKLIKSASLRNLKKSKMYAV